MVTLAGCDFRSQGKNVDTIAANLQPVLDSMTRNLGIPGVTFAVRFSDGPAVCLASGLADREEQKVMVPGDLMLSGSVGKTFVAAVVLKLAETGKISLNTKVSAYLGSEPWFGGVPNADRITVKMLLNHTAGVPEYVYQDKLWQQVSANPDKTWSVAERMQFIAGAPPSNPPGGGWNYADSHYIILGALIEKVTGKSYNEVLREMILVPCNLDHTLPADRRDIAGLAAGYTELTRELYLPHKVLNNGLYAFNPQLEWTGGGLVTTVDDLTKWASMLYGGTILPERMKKEMLTSAPFTTTLPFNARYGLGCIIGENGAWYGHTGFAPGYITILQYIPEKRISLAMQVNTDALHGKRAKEVFEVLKKKILDQVL
jgi:D-alanyl-D-alanine carboxypeptidase